MKIFVFLSIYLLVPFTVFTQETSELVSIKWGDIEDYEYKRKPGKYQIDEYYYRVSEEKSSLIITKNDAESELIKKAKLPIEHELVKGKVYFDRFIEINDRYWILSKIKNKNELKFHFILQEVDLENLSFTGKPRELLSFNYLRRGSWEKLNISHNEGSEVFMVTYYDAVVNSSNEITDYISIGRLYDSNWEVVKEIKIDLPKLELRYLTNTFILTKSNKILAFQKTSKPNYFDEDEVLESGPTWSVKLITPELKPDYEKYMILNKQKIIDPFTGYTAMERDNVVTVMGYYNEDDENIAQGVAFKKIDFNNNEKESIVLNAFESVEKRPVETLYDPNTLHFVNGKFLEADNGYYFITHKMTQKKGKYMYPSGDVRVGLYTVMEGIHIFYFDKNGKQLWTKEIPYLQFFPEGRTSSSNEFLTFLFEDNLYFLYDGYNPQDDKEKELKLNKMLFAKKRVIMTGVIQPDGELATNKMFPNEDDSKYNTSLRISYQVKDEPVFNIMYVTKTKTKYGYLIFKEP